VEEQAIKDVYEQALTCLSSEDQELAQIKMILPLLLQVLSLLALLFCYRKSAKY
jgi:hypothetical protein